MTSETHAEEETHALPPWFDKLQMVVMLPLLLTAEGVINGNMLALGIPGDTPEHLFERSVMYITGFLMGGMALRCSATAAQSFQRREIVFTLINVLGIGLFALPEVWASLVVRGVNLPVTGPDTWLLGQLGVVGTQLTPSNVFVSIMLPLVTVFWGFATRKRTRLSNAELEEIERAKTIKAAGRKERAALNGGAVGATFGGMFNAAKEQVTGTKTSQVAEEEPIGLRVLGPTDSRPREPGGSQVAGPGKGPWSARQIQQYMALEYPQVSLAEGALLEYMKAPGDAGMKARLVGTTYRSNITAVKAWFRRTYGSPKSEMAPETTREGMAVS